MDITRRKFITGAAAAIGTAALLKDVISISPMTSADAQSENLSYRGAVAILQGFTNQTSTQLTVLFEKTKPVYYKVLNGAGHEISYQITRREQRSHSIHALEKISIDHLLLGVNYTFQVLDQSSGKVIDERNFAALDMAKKNPRVVVASCMKDIYVGPREYMWERVAQVKPDLILLSGDTCYADQGSDGDEAGYWRRNSETRTRLSHFRLKNLTPTLAIWDDHDYGVNNGDGTYSEKNMVREVFQIFWDSEERLGLARGPGQSLVVSAFGQRYFMLDGRFFKSKEKGSKNTMFGTEQEEFIFSELGKSKDPAWLMNGLLFFGGYVMGESYEKDHNANFKEFLKGLSQEEAPVAFLSGDIHYSEAMKIEAKILGYETVEYVSSSIHSSHFPGLHLRGRNPRRIDATSTQNFAVIDSSVAKNGDWNIQMDCLNDRLARKISHQTVIKR